MPSNLKNIIITLMVILEVSVTFAFWAFFGKKNLSTHLLTTYCLHVIEATSADLATTSAAADAALGDVRTADGDEINGASLQKSESTFFGVHETYVICGNQRTNEIQSIDLLNIRQDKKRSNSKNHSGTCFRRT